VKLMPAKVRPIAERNEKVSWAFNLVHKKPAIYNCSA
jgi:hypothetical protein